MDNAHHATNPVAALIARHDLTQAAVATLLGVTPRAVSYYLSGNRPISTPILLLCQVMCDGRSGWWWSGPVAEARRKHPDRRRKEFKG
jgi:transcriptional regulator with XRE-family HTH domain